MFWGFELIQYFLVLTIHHRVESMVPKAVRQHLLNSGGPHIILLYTTYNHDSCAILNGLAYTILYQPKLFVPKESIL